MRRHTILRDRRGLTVLALLGLIAATIGLLTALLYLWPAGEVQTPPAQPTAAPDSMPPSIIPIFA